MRPPSLLLPIFCVLLSTYGGCFASSRQLHQAVSVDIDATNVGTFPELIQTATPGTTFILQQAEILLTQSLYIGVNDLTLQGHSIEQRPVIRCIGNDTTTIIRIEVDADGVELRDVVVEGCSGPALRILNRNVRDKAPLQGGLRTVTIRNVEFRENLQPMHASFDPLIDGGAMQVNAGTKVTVASCQFQRNYGVVGGAIRLFGASVLTISDSLFEDNQANIAGGAIFVGALAQIPGIRSKLTVKQCAFYRNKDLSGGEDSTGLRLPNGAPLETNALLRFPTPQSSAGAIFVSRFDRVVISNNHFENNTAIAAGGALSILDNHKIQISDNSFLGNRANIPFSERSRPDLSQGGAVYVALSEDRSEIVVERCQFRSNRASFGAGMHLVGPLAAKAQIFDCDFDDHVALLGGGGLLIRNIVQVSMHRLRFRHNTATLGGGLMLANGAGAIIFQGVLDSSDTLFLNNEALDGGGCCFLAAGAVVGQSLIFTLNKAQRNGGGLAMIESTFGGSVSLQDNKFSNNSAHYGGAIYQDTTFNFRIAKTFEGTSFLSGNHALAGGAVYLQPWSQLRNDIDIQDTVFTDNNAVLMVDALPQLARALPVVDVSRIDGGSFFVDNHIQRSTCRPGDGGGICITLVPLLPRASRSISFSNCKFVQNNAIHGGGILISESAQSNCVEECPITADNVPVSTSVCPSIHFEQVFFTDNQALGSGEGTNGDSMLLIEADAVKWSCQNSQQA